MTQLEAAMKDAAWRRNAKEKRNMRKIGSCFKGCNRCGEWEMRERHVRSECGSYIETKEYKHWYTGTQVYESYTPQATGWTFWCWDCGAKDDVCWGKGEPEPKQTSLRDKDLRIMELERQLKELTVAIKK
jgi:hypothetical protein